MTKAAPGPVSLASMLTEIDKLRADRLAVAFGEADDERDRERKRRLCQIATSSPTWATT